MWLIGLHEAGMARFKDRLGGGIEHLITQSPFKHPDNAPYPGLGAMLPAQSGGQGYSHQILVFAYTVLPLTRSSGFLTSELTSSLNEINHLRCCMNGQGVRGVAWPWRDVGRHFAGKVELPIGYVGEQRNQQVLQRNHPNAKLHQLGIRQVRHLGLRIRGG